jgi:hypothetical protein
MSLRCHVDRLLPVNFVPDETSNVRWLAIDKSPAYLEANLDMPICQQHLLRCIKLHVELPVADLSLYSF